MSAQISPRGRMAPDIMYFLTFTLGMGAFWLSGRAATLLPHIANRSLATTLSMVVTALVYGLILAIWTAVIGGGLNIRRILLAVVPAVLLGMVAAQVLLRLAAGRLHNTSLDIGLFTFALFVCYGLIYVFSLALARRIVR